MHGQNHIKIGIASVQQVPKHCSENSVTSVPARAMQHRGFRACCSGRSACILWSFYHNWALCCRGICHWWLL